MRRLTRKLAVPSVSDVPTRRPARCPKPPTIRIRQQPSRHDPQSRDSPVISRSSSGSPPSVRWAVGGSCAGCRHADAADASAIQRLGLDRRNGGPRTGRKHREPVLKAGARPFLRGRRAVPHAAIMMHLGLRLTPHGHLVCDTAADMPGMEEAVAARIEAAFAHGSGPGLLRLGAGEVGRVLPPIFGWWREFAARYVTALCHAAPSEGGHAAPAVVPNIPSPDEA